MVKGNSALWRVPSGASSADYPEPTASTKIEFDLDALYPDSTGHISNTSAIIKTGIAENESPFRDVNELQFTKLENVTVTVVGHVQAPDTSLVSKLLKVWVMDDQSIPDTFTKGRIGARFNDNPVFNVKPYQESSGHPRAYAIESVEWKRAELRGRLDFVIILRLSGDLKTGTGDSYDWST